MSRTAMWTIGALGVAVLLAVPAASLAVYPGENGKVAYVSGAGGAPGNDNDADLYVLDGPGDTTPVALDTATGQHRHPSWSPDLKKIAYALWDAPTNDNAKVWIKYLATGATERVGIHSSAVKDDRPSWSPDGTRIAYESEVTDGSGQMDILIWNVQTHASVNLTETSNMIEGKPVWSRDGKTIYYSRRPLASMDDDIYKEASNNSQALPTPVLIGAIAEYQAALSPNGKKLCYTRGAFGSAEADVYVVASDGSDAPGVDISDTTLGAYNCAWSPDGIYIAYALGTFTNGVLMFDPATDTGVASPMTPDVANHFDGNPDWAPVRPAFCDGRPATMAGTGGKDTLKGTPGRDVIAGFDGADTIKGLGGNDLLCGGKGNDIVNGGPGKDKCLDGPGRDLKVDCEL